MAVRGHAVEGPQCGGLKVAKRLRAAHQTLTLNDATAVGTCHT